MTASAFTAEFTARFARGHADTRAKAEPPAQLLPFTAIAVATAFALLFVPPSPLDFREVSAAGLLACALLGLALSAQSFPGVAAIGIPVGYIAFVALLRDAAGGSSSGFGGLLLLPVLWLAVTAGRRELAAILFAMAVAQLVPLGLVGPPRYPASGFRGAFVLTTVAAITGLMVQRLVAETRNQNERLLELDHLKDEFVATASHELRTPLTSLSGYLEMSLDPAEGSLSPTRENHLRIAQRNARPARRPRRPAPLPCACRLAPARASPGADRSHGAPDRGRRECRAGSSGEEHRARDRGRGRAAVGSRRPASACSASSTTSSRTRSSSLRTAARVRLSARRRRRRGDPRGRRLRGRHSLRRPTGSLQPFLPRPECGRGRAFRGAGSAWRSLRSSPKRTGARSRSRALPARGRPSGSRFRSRND